MIYLENRFHRRDAENAEKSSGLKMVGQGLVPRHFPAGDKPPAYQIVIPAGG